VILKPRNMLGGEPGYLVTELHWQETPSKS
jgi:hypothetical protein